MNLTRRDLLAASAVPALGSLTGGLLTRHKLAAATAVEDRILVVIQLKGGNDWLNTVIPATHTVYQAARPTIKISPTQGLPCGTSATNGPLFLHPTMVGMKRLWDAGKLALVSGVGYPGQTLSHFQAEDVWYQASPTPINGGWLGRYFGSGSRDSNDVYSGGYDMPAVLAQTDGNPSLSFSGFTPPSLTNPQLLNLRTDPSSVSVDGLLEQQMIVNHVLTARPNASPNLAHVKGVLERVMSSATRFVTVGSAYVPRATYPLATSNPLTIPLQLIARYVTGASTSPGSGLDSRCYYFTTPSQTSMVGGFDTHSSQGGATGTQANLLGQVSDAVEAFINDLVGWGHAHRVVVMIWTEFTRRVGENGSRGTDHGEAGGVMLCGDPVVGGNYGVYPDLAPIRPPYEQQNLAVTTDFRNVYATVLQKWWGASTVRAIPNWNPTLLGFLP